MVDLSSSDTVPMLPLPRRAWEAACALEMSSKWALFCIFLGWFFIPSLTVTLGSLQHAVKFFDISAVIADPTRMFFGINGSVQRILFGTVCIACLLAPLLPYVRGRRADWYGYFAPLALMLICAALLYHKASAEFFSTPSDAGSVSGNFIRFANQLVDRGSGLVAKHVSVGVGGYLALIGSVVLAVNGARHLRRLRGAAAP